jgi:two-component system phosphate regulon response regulator PhoB
MSRILVVEDEAAIAELLALNLRHSGHEVVLAADAEQAQLEVDAVLPDLVVLDWMLPDQSGVTLARRWRNAERTRAVPIIMLTARSDEADKIAGLDAGADDYLTKPFTFAELSARLRALIRRSYRVASPVIRIGDLEIDTAARRVARGGRPLELRAKEYALLELLALNRGKVVTRTQILDHIWGHDSDTLSNVVDVHVCRLRGMVDREFDVPLLHTVRGQGYRLEAP